MEEKKVLIIIPAYNEEANIELVVDNLIRNYSQYDYIVVNDGSADNTAAICRNCGYQLLDLPVNLGLAGAFQAGLKYADACDYDYAIQFDADGQHRAEYIGDLLQKAQEGYDIVIGSRFVKKRKPAGLRMMGSFLISFAIRITTGKKIKDPTSGMRIFNKRLIHEFATNLNYGPEPDTVSYLMRQGAKVCETQVEMSERVVGESYLNFSRSISYMLRMGTSILLIQWFRKKNKNMFAEQPIHDSKPMNQAGGTV